MPSTPHAQEFGVLETTSWRGVARAKSVPDMFPSRIAQPRREYECSCLTGPSLAKLTNEAE